MTGPEHYREAEFMLAQVEGHSISVADGMAYLAAAQVHATLALAAAEALATTATQPPHLTDAGADWREVLKPVVEATA